MQSVSSRIWTLVAVSISYDDNHYSTGTSEACVSFGQLFKLVYVYAVIQPVMTGGFEN